MLLSRTSSKTKLLLVDVENDVVGTIGLPWIWTWEKYEENAGNFQLFLSQKQTLYYLRENSFTSKRAVNF